MSTSTLTILNKYFKVHPNKITHKVFIRKIELLISKYNLDLEQMIIWSKKKNLRNFTIWISDIGVIKKAVFKSNYPSTKLSYVQMVMKRFNVNEMVAKQIIKNFKGEKI